jgi:hypothetical protein
VSVEKYIELNKDVTALQWSCPFTSYQIIILYKVNDGYGGYKTYS